MTRREWFKRTALGTLWLIGLGAVEATAAKSVEWDVSREIQIFPEEGEPWTFTMNEGEWTQWPNSGEALLTTQSQHSTLKEFVAYSKITRFKRIEA